MSVNPRLWQAVIVLEDDNVASEADVADILRRSIPALLTGKPYLVEGAREAAVPFAPDEVVSVSVTPLPMTGGQREFPPYTPEAGDPADAFDAPLTAQELALAVDIFQQLKLCAMNVRYGELPPPDQDRCVYYLDFAFNETNPPEARVHVHFRSAEPSSGYDADGVGPDLATALSRMSDDDSTNGSAALPEPVIHWCAACEREGLRTRSNGYAWVGGDVHEERCSYHWNVLERDRSRN